MTERRVVVSRWVDQEPTEWKNGGGLTRELVSSPSDTDAFDWRVSIADIEAPGPFSRFPGVDRVITLLEGSAMVLHFDAGEKVLVPGEPFRFNGDDTVTCSLPDGPTRALNLMTRRGRVTGEVVVRERGAEPVVVRERGAEPVGENSRGRRLVVALEDGLTVTDDSGDSSDSVETWGLARYDVLDTTEAIALVGAAFAVITVGT